LETKVNEIELNERIEEELKFETITFLNENGEEESYSIPIINEKKENPEQINTVKEDPKEKIVPNNDQNIFFFKIFGFNFKIPFSRLELEETFDKNNSILEIFKMVGTSLLSSWILYRLIFTLQISKTLVTLIIFSFATSQFSLIKSPQPDAHSPFHITPILLSYSRSFYFILFGGSSLLSNYFLEIGSSDVIQFFNISFSVDDFLYFFRNVSVFLVVFIPLLFLFGFPNLKTFTLFLFEYIHIHIFGGTGGLSIIGIIILFLIDTFVTLVLVTLGYFSKFDQTISIDLLRGVYGSLLVGLTYFKSRLSSNSHFFTKIILSILSKLRITYFDNIVLKNVEDVDPLRRVVLDTLKSVFIVIVLFPIQMTNILNIYSYYFNILISILIVLMGFIIHYIVPEFQRPQPFFIFSKPFIHIKNIESDAQIENESFFQNPFDYEIKIKQIFKFLLGIEGDTIKILHLIILIIKKFQKILVVFLVISSFGDIIEGRFSTLLLITICSIKILCNSFSLDSSKIYIAVFYNLLFTYIDLSYFHSQGFIINLSILIYFVYLFEHLKLKLHFILIFSVPLVSYSSLTHILLHPLSIRHFGLFVFQLIISTIFFMPIYPFYGAPLWMLSYFRSLKYWEKDYKSKRLDLSNSKMIESLEVKNKMEDNTNLNTIFYEHLNVSLKNELIGLIEIGEMRSIQEGDFYLIKKDKITSLVHIIELGNGFCTFQMRGLEFKGTYCQERELESLEETSNDTTYKGLEILQRYNILTKNLKITIFYSKAIGNSGYHRFEVKDMGGVKSRIEFIYIYHKYNKFE
jgi:hypothetical protein